MAMDPRDMEKELYQPVRELIRRYSLDDPQLPMEIQKIVDSVIEKNPQLEQHEGSIYNSAISHLHGYVLGRTEERNLKEWARIGVNGIKLVLESFLKYKELEIRERELEKKENSS